MNKEALQYFEQYPNIELLLKVKDQYFLEESMVAAKIFAAQNKVEVEVLNRKDIGVVDGDIKPLDTKSSKKNKQSNNK